jgi:phosphatidylglycerol lysyltransferase
MEQSVSAGWRDRAVRALALLVGAVGVVNVVGALRPAAGARLALLAPYVPGVARHGAHLAAALLGFALLLLAQNLWRRKQVAWLLAIVLLGLSAAVHLLKGLEWEAALVALATAIGLWGLRDEFQAQSDPPSVRRGLIVLASSLAFTVLYGALGFYLLDRHFGMTISPGAAVRQAVLRLITLEGPVPVTGFGRYFGISLFFVAGGTVSYGLLALFRPVVGRGPATAAERERARQIVVDYGHTFVAPFTLLPDKAYFFSPGGSVVAYTVKGRVAVALGDPVGPAADLGPAIRGFQQHCVHADWRSAFVDVPAESVAAYRTAGFHLLHIGDEAIVDLAGFTLQGNDNKRLRAAVNRLAKAGYRTEHVPPPLSDALLRELRAVSDEWLTMMHGREKRFALGWFDDDYLRSGPVMVVRAPDGRLTAFGNIVTEFQKKELTLDLIRRRRQVENGTMDFLFAGVFQWARDQGFSSFNQGLSPLAGVGNAATDPAAERALHYLFEHVNRFYDFQGLRAFKEKFHPRWEPRYLAFPGPGSLPTVVVALVRALAGDDFLVDAFKDLQGRRVDPGPKPGPPSTAERPGATSDPGDPDISLAGIVQQVYAGPSPFDGRRLPAPRAEPAAGFVRQVRRAGSANGAALNCGLAEGSRCGARSG